ncbi:MAG: DNA-binding transcriptional LysR family regulator [Bacteriovoracaceae bacterium]|jgi:DNA-binding transcriptional LysR family regulator
MELKLDDLQAFLNIYQAGTFTKAAKDYGLTQSALSQKIRRIEETLQTAVFIRHPRSLSLTPSGEKLLAYAKEIALRQNEFLKSFDQYNHEISGVIRLAAFSSVMRSMLIPKLAPFIRKNSGVSLELTSYEMYELEDVLKTNKSDFIVTDYEPSLGGIESIKISSEEYVIIKSKKHPKAPHIFLDHGPQDNATLSYHKFIGKKIDYERAYLGDVYAIIDGVAEGLGKAVMSKHLIEKDKRFFIQKEKKRYLRPIYLSYYSQAYYSPLQEKVLSLLSSL